jgi:ketosteroid isomerase-like protein
MRVGIQSRIRPKLGSSPPEEGGHLSAAPSGGALNEGISLMCTNLTRAAAHLGCAVVLLLTGCARGQTDLSARSEPFHRILDAQAEAWNRGDIDGFMHHYWRSDQLTFSSAGHTRRGWTETKARYEQRYPTPERMGQLEFTDVETHMLGDSAALVLGRWHLTRQPDSIGGNFSLVFELIDGQWKIIHDHTSATPSE